MKIYTRTGDQGTTGLVGGERIRKDDLLIEAIGQVDTLNAQLGYLYDLLIDQKIDQLEIISEIQGLLFLLGSHLADPNKKCNLRALLDRDVILLESQIDLMTDQIPKLTQFILPRGNKVASWAHVTRATCRSVERACLEFLEQDKYSLAFLNRLSDYLFTLSRYIIFFTNSNEITWDSSKYT